MTLAEVVGGSRRSKAQAGTSSARAPSPRVHHERDHPEDGERRREAITRQTYVTGVCAQI